MSAATEAYRVVVRRRGGMFEAAKVVALKKGASLDASALDEL